MSANTATPASVASSVPAAPRPVPGPRPKASTGKPRSSRKSGSGDKSKLLRDKIVAADTARREFMLGRTILETTLLKDGDTIRPLMPVEYQALVSEVPADATPTYLGRLKWVMAHVSQAEKAATARPKPGSGPRTMAPSGSNVAAEPESTEVKPAVANLPQIRVNKALVRAARPDVVESVRPRHGRNGYGRDHTMTEEAAAQSAAALKAKRYGAPVASKSPVRAKPSGK